MFHNSHIVKMEKRNANWLLSLENVNMAQNASLVFSQVFLISPKFSWFEDYSSLNGIHLTLQPFWQNFKHCLHQVINRYGPYLIVKILLFGITQPLIYNIYVCTRLGPILVSVLFVHDDRIQLTHVLWSLGYTCWVI